MVIDSLSIIPKLFGGRWRIAIYLIAIGAATPLAAESAPPAPAQHPRPSVEERRTFEKQMEPLRPTKPGCFEAHYPEKRWIETECLPAPRTPNPHASGPLPNTVGAGTNRFAIVTSGNISQATGSFDSVSGVVSIEGFKGNNDTTTVYPDVYELQMNANKFTTTVGGCNNDANCSGWEQFLMSQSQCGSQPCVFIEYWLLNFPNPNNVANPCPTNASWNWYPGTSTTTPGCFLNTPAKSLSAIPVSDLAGIKMNAAIANGIDTVTMSDASGTLGIANNTSIANLAAGWTGVEYGLFGDCCAYETFFTATTNATLKVRVAVVNGTQNAPNCATSGFNGTTAETNNLSLTGGCTAVSGADPAIVFTMSGGGSLPPGVSVGDPHLTTFHGAHYNYQYSGEYILAEADPDFQVQVRQVIITPPTKPAIAYNTGAAVRMGADRFAVTLNSVEVNGRPSVIRDGETIQLSGAVTVDRRGSTYTISRPIGDIVHINVLGDHVDISVTVGATNAASVRGLLVGSGDEQHPFVGRDKKPVHGLVTTAALRDFIESWRIEPNESAFSDQGRPSPSGPVEGLTVDQLDAAKANEAKKQCTDRGVKETTALEDCILDVAVTGKPELADGFVFASKPKLVVHEH
jgi:hypothetical protein